MARKQITIETTVCDYCDSDEYPIFQCPLCGKDVCRECSFELGIKMYNFHVCKEHKDEPFEKVYTAMSEELKRKGI